MIGTGFIKSLTRRTLVLGFFVFSLPLMLGGQIFLHRVSAQSATDPVVVINKKTANVRFGPGMQYDVLATINRGTPLPLIGQFSNRGQIWFQVHLRGIGDYWIASWAVDINVDIGTVPTVTYKGTSGTENTGGNATVPQRNSSGSGGSSASSSGSGGGSSGGGTTSNPPPSSPATTPEAP